jgi:glutaredoxin
MPQPFMIVTVENCPWCTKAVALLRDTNTPFDTMSKTNPQFAARYAPFVPHHHTTAPLVFHGHVFIGGYTALEQYIGG